MKVGRKDPIGALKADTWIKDYDSTLSSAATSVTISSLTGDTAEEYILRCRFVNGYNGTTNVYLRPNNDSGANYGEQRIYGADTSANADRTSGLTGFFAISIGDTTAKRAMVEANLYAKSGYVRTIIERWAIWITGTTVSTNVLKGASWNNTADEITSLVILASQANGLGIGTNITLWKKVSST